MLQIDVTPFASDALEDAMCLAQTKALNSYTFSDCINYLNYTWSDIYNSVAMIDDGYYGQTMRLTKKLTRLPDYVKNTVMVYRAQSPVDYNRLVYRDAGTADMTASCTYRISGKDIYCADAESFTVWLYYVPACPQLFFTHHNRDPKLYDEYTMVRSNHYNLYRLIGYVDTVQVDITDNDTDLKDINKLVLKHLSGNESLDIDITEYILKQEDAENGTMQLQYISCDYPYIFCTYKNSLTGECTSGFYTRNYEWNEYNPFAFTGKASNVEYLSCSYNDKTGMGVVVIDHGDSDKIKELGWTPDAPLKYPAPEMYRYLVARLADKFAALNESSITGVQRELVEARFAFNAFLEKDKSAWKRIENVNPSTIGDWI